MKNILFFADRLPPLIGGMETHADNFIKYFSVNSKYKLIDIVTLNSKGENCIIQSQYLKPIDIYKHFDKEGTYPDIIFFNSGRWIESFDEIRANFPNSLLMYRTGGNEIIKANLAPDKVLNHKQRQEYWAGQINRNLNFVVTNSEFTENRLTTFGISPNLFIRCVGGVDVSLIKDVISKQNNNVNKKLKFICAARFVPYKNHKRIIEAFSKLNSNGYDFILVLIGDGPLLDKTKQLAKTFEIENKVTFTGRISNKETLIEIVNADYYIQMSLEYLVKLDDGEYIHAECMGRGLLEAISANIPIIAANSGAINEIVKGNRGILADPLSVDDMVTQLVSIINNPLINTQSTEEYSWNNYFKKYETLWNKY